jgi:Tfp pilus assembly protein PilW
MMLNLKRQHGVSLISTLVGLLLGLIAILGAASVYRTLVFKSLDMKTRAKQDFSVNAAMLATDIDISKAGYGVEHATASCLGATPGPSATANTDFILLTGAALATPAGASSTVTGTAATIAGIGSAAVTGNAVIWHYLEANAHKCAGLVATQGGLVRLAPMTCTNATDWNTLNWTLQKLIEYNTLPAATGSFADKSVVFGASRTGSCSPFKSSAGLPAVELTITAGNSAANLLSTQSLCLPNICQ